MQQFEYRVVPAPRRGEKARGLKTTEDRFAHALTELMNELARDGWEYWRADTLPCEERAGLTGKTTTFQNLLVFRRPKVATVAASVAAPLAAAPGLGPARREEGAAPPVGPAPSDQDLPKAPLRAE